MQTDELMIEQPDESEIDTYVLFVRKIVEMKGIDDEATIDEANEKIQRMFDYSDQTANRVKRKLLSIMGHRMDMGTMIMADHKAWFLSRTKETKMICTQRNLRYLNEDRNLPSDIISKLDDITNDIMEGVGDPCSEAFKRRGLVMGDVQSGKTNTYTTLSCKATDVGYRMIIILTGTLEILRRQTQARLDEGLVGEDSAIMIKNDTLKKLIGVGRIDSDPKFGVFTTTENDFRVVAASQLNFPVANLDFPVLLVVKKNKKILDTLQRWLMSKSMNGVIHSPLLLIDDEADNASVNTSFDEVTAINKGIRNILGLFSKSTYIGFTATPYANIFINPEEDEDLYPRDFIYCLKSPNNYVGPKSIYQEGGDHQYMLKTIELCEKDQEVGLPELPYKHSKEFIIKQMPRSMEEAINCFFISCTIRDLRGHTRSHMSMMVNASRFTKVQESVKELISNYVFEVKDAISVHSKLPESEALKNRYLSSLKIAWMNNYKETGYDWKTIQHALEQSVKPIAVRSVNQKNGPKNLNYSECPDGLRVIAVGGNSLSRGLTLEGLCISYFYRKSKNYDTLMQMGRWFGYREGYADLCRVWMTAESADWYDGISNATEELKREFVLMYNLNKTPKDFGFRVRMDVNGLFITARNKMMYTGEDYIVKSLNGSLIWTSHVNVDSDSVCRNNDLLVRTVKALNEYKMPYFNKQTNNFVWRAVQGSEVVRFLESFSHPQDENVTFDSEAVINMIRSGQLTSNWDIAIQHGVGDEHVPLKELNLNIKMVKRGSFRPKKDGVIRFNSSGLITPANLKEGIYRTDLYGNEEPDEEEIRRLEVLFEGHKQKEAEHRRFMGEEVEDKKISFPAKTYLNTPNRRPLLLIYPLQLLPLEVENNEDETRRKKEIVSKLEGTSPIGVALGFPYCDVDPNNPQSDRFIIRYKTTAVYEKMGGNEDLDQEEDE